MGRKRNRDCAILGNICLRAVFVFCRLNFIPHRPKSGICQSGERFCLFMRIIIFADARRRTPCGHSRRFCNAPSIIVTFCGNHRLRLRFTVIASRTVASAFYARFRACGILMCDISFFVMSQCGFYRNVCDFRIAVRVRKQFAAVFIRTLPIFARAVSRACGRNLRTVRNLVRSVNLHGLLIAAGGGLAEREVAFYQRVGRRKILGIIIRGNNRKSGRGSLGNILRRSIAYAVLGCQAVHRDSAVFRDNYISPAATDRRTPR